MKPGPFLQLVLQEEYERFLERRLAVAESRAQNSYHCQTADCLGWCIYEDDVNDFRCPICWALNCLVCKVSRASRALQQLGGGGGEGQGPPC